MWDELSEQAVLASKDEKARADLIKQEQSNILAAASAVTHTYVTTSDDAWSAALSAFSKAIDTYDERKGPFKPYSKKAIEFSVLDYLRRENRHSNEIPVSNTVFEGREENPDSFAYAASVQIVQDSMQQSSPLSLRQEIEAASEEFKAFGFSFFDLPAVSPKQDKTMRQCALAVRWMVMSGYAPDEMRRTKKIPVREISENTGISSKLLDRYRKYIIALTILITSDYPQLSSYTAKARKEAGL